MTLTPKQEAFVQSYLETGNASEAYRSSGYSGGNPKTVHEAASRLLKNSKVIARLAELQKIHQERHEVTVDSLVAELDEARQLALKTEAPAAAVSATMGKGKLLGLIVEKNEHTGKGGEPIQFQRIERVIIDPADQDAPSVPAASRKPQVQGS